MNFLLSPYLILNLGWPQGPVSLKGKGMAGGMNQWVNEVNSRQSHHRRGIRKWGSQNMGPLLFSQPNLGWAAGKAHNHGCPPRTQKPHGRTWKQDVYGWKRALIFHEVFQRILRRCHVTEDLKKVRTQVGHTFTVAYTHTSHTPQRWKALVSSPPISLRSLTLDRRESMVTFRIPMHPWLIMYTCLIRD